MKKLTLILLPINIIAINTTQILSCSKMSDKKSNKTVIENENENNNHKNTNSKNKNNNKKPTIPKDENNNNNNNNNNNSKDDTSDFIIDFNSSYNNPINTSRGWKGTLYEQSNINKFLSDNDTGYHTFTSEQTEFIKKLTIALHSPASKATNKKFNNFLNQKTFLSFNNLIDTINTHNKNSPENAYIDVPLEVIRNHANNPNLFEETMLKTYNTLAYFFGKNYGYKILRTLAISRRRPGETSSVLGETSFQQGRGNSSISMHVNEGILKSHNSKSEYEMGWITTSHIYETFVHEFGHAIYFFHMSNYPFHETIDSYSGLNNIYSIESIAHNEYKKNYCLSINTTCPYKFKPQYYHSNFEVNNTAYERMDYSFDQSNALIDFILSKVKNLKVPGENSDEQNNFIKNMLLRIFINSDYGRSIVAEVHSEGFAYWLLTPENERDKAWEIWNEFFLDYLPHLRSRINHFNDYLKT